MALIDHTALQQQTEGTALQTWARQLPGELERLFAEGRRHGDFDRWMKILSRLPELPPGEVGHDLLQEHREQRRLRHVVPDGIRRGGE